MAIKTICAVPGCGKVHAARGFCQTHYMRVVRGGDPFAPGRPEVPMCAHKCSVEGCEVKARKSGMCGRHFMRFKRYGDPLAGCAANGEGERWLHEHVSYCGDECLTWPFGGKTGFGYGAAYIAGKHSDAHRAMCLLAHGEPPTPEHHAAHWCGNGHQGCVNPKHLRWATVVENTADKVVHGTIVRGEKCPQSKLTEQDVREIRGMGRSFMHHEIADIFNVHRVTITDILSGRTWAWLA